MSPRVKTCEAKDSHRTQQFAPWEGYLGYWKQIIVPSPQFPVLFVPCCRTSHGLGQCLEGTPLPQIQDNLKMQKDLYDGTGMPKDSP